VSAKYPIKPKPPTLIITPKKNNNVSHSSLGATYANILVGVLSAVVDNIPVMFAVLTMNPDMGLNQWSVIWSTSTSTYFPCFTILC
jgi:Na+/H+ antiporter NhaD/arsenite permease-like protein